MIPTLFLETPFLTRTFSHVLCRTLTSIIINCAIYLQPAQILSLFFAFYGSSHHVQESTIWNWNLLKVSFWLNKSSEVRRGVASFLTCLQYRIFWSHQSYFDIYIVSIQTKGQACGVVWKKGKCLAQAATHQATFTL